VNGSAMVRVGIAVGMLTVISGCHMEVVTPVIVTKVTVEPGQAVVPQGDNLQFTATVFDEFDEPLNQAEVVWSSERPQVVSVAADGAARALAWGSSLVRASFDGVSGSALVTVLPSPDCSPSNGGGRGRHDDDDDDDEDDSRCAPPRG
jgi:Bacterial Ig-like domain (group 2)